MWSTSPLVSTTALIGLARRPAFGSACSCGVVVDLLAQVRRGVEQRPVDAVAADRKRRLRAAPEAGFAGPHVGAIAAVAVPLRKTAACGRAQNLDDHCVRLVAGAPTPDKTTAAECSTAVVGNSQELVSGSTVVR